MQVCDQCGIYTKRLFRLDSEKMNGELDFIVLCKECNTWFQGQVYPRLTRYRTGKENQSSWTSSFSSSKNRPIRIGIIRGKGPVLKWKIGMTKKQVVAAKRRIYYKKHRAEIIAYQKKWRLKHQKQWKAYQQKYAKKRWAEKHQ